MTDQYSATLLVEADRLEVEVRPRVDLYDEIERRLAAGGYRKVSMVGCPIDGAVTIRVDGKNKLWRSGQPDVLHAALATTHDAVDPEVAWAQTTVAINEDHDRLVVAIPDLSGVDLRVAPPTVDVITVEIDGSLGEFDPEGPAGPRQWDQATRYLTAQIMYAVRRGESLDVSALVWDGEDRPLVTASAEPGDHLDLGHGFYVETWPEDGVDDFPEPIAPFRRRELATVADALTREVASWRISPINIAYATCPHRRGLYDIPD